MKPSIKHLVKSKQRHDARVYMPFKDFEIIYNGIVTAEKEVSRSSLSNDTKWMLHRNYVISITTAVEVYFRDMFIAFGSIAESNGHRLPLNKLHHTLYSVDEMQAFYLNKISPHMVVANSLNFQNYRNIGTAFTHLINQSFWPAVVEYSETHAKGKEWQVTNKVLASFKETLLLRHQLVHNHGKAKLTSKEQQGILSTLFVVVASNSVLVAHIASQLLVDPSKKKTAPASTP